MPTLVVSPAREDHEYLGGVLRALGRRAMRAHSRAEGESVLRGERPRAVVCERDLPDGGWKDVLEIMAVLEDMPPLVVVSKLADERLWAEVLNLGGYDVLAKPFDASEAMRVMEMATRCRARTPDRKRRVA